MPTKPEAWGGRSRPCRSGSCAPTSLTTPGDPDGSGPPGLLLHGWPALPEQESRSSTESPRPAASAIRSTNDRDRTPDSRPTAEPAEIVRSFLLALEAGQIDEALSLLADDVVYTKVSLPTIRGRARIERLFRPALEKLRGRFRVHFHTVATNGQTVLTERTDALILGRLEHRLWVYGRFEVTDGRITVWRDSFDWLDLFLGLIRGLAGVFIPKLNRRWPGEH